MKDALYPPKLQAKAMVRVVSPSASLALVSRSVLELACTRLTGLGLQVRIDDDSFVTGELLTAPVEVRIRDLHRAFADPECGGILCALGGYSCIGLLPEIDFELIERNPKILSGFSDITILLNAIWARTHVVTYLGPNFSLFGMQEGADYIVDNFVKCCMGHDPFEVRPSTHWSDDRWWLDQEHRTFLANEGTRPIHFGQASGRLIGGNLDSFNLLSGTPYAPSLENSVILIEEEGVVTAREFDRNLDTLLSRDDASEIVAVLIGRFERRSEIGLDTISKIVESKPKLSGVPVIANLDFGHTCPITTLPIGGEVQVSAEPDKVQLKLLEH